MKPETAINWLIVILLGCVVVLHLVFIISIVLSAII